MPKQFHLPRKYIYFILIFYWLILLTATSLPSESVPTIGVGDKFNHFGAYLILAVLLYLTILYQNKFEQLKKHTAFFTIFIASVYGIFDELHQALIPGRSCEFLDWAADFAGILAGVLIVKYIILKRIVVKP